MRMSSRLSGVKLAEFLIHGIIHLKITMILKNFGHIFYDGYFTWSFDEKFLIKSVLSLPLSSSDAERG